jgi:hypothetical protein
MLLDFGNQWISSIVEFWSLFSHVLMVKSQGMLGSLKSTNEGERRWALSVFCRNWTVGEEGETLEEAGKKYKYPPSFQWSLKCGSASLSAAVPGYDTASLQVRHCRTHQTTRIGKLFCWLFSGSKRMLLTKYEHLVTHFNQMLSPLILGLFLY